MPPTQPVAGVKRKHTAVNLETIELDPHYDLTLIVGTPEHKDGQKAFRVNKGSMRHVSDIWSKMLTGEWAESKMAESKMAEIEFPEDSWKPFHIALKIAHLQVADLPNILFFQDLLDLATLADKYNLVKAVRVGLDLKQWLHKHEDQWREWPSPPAIQQFAVITSVFEYDWEQSYIISKLAVEVMNGGEGFVLSYGPSKIGLANNLPNKILVKITAIRTHLLLGIKGTCKLAIANASKRDAKTHCKRPRCAVTRAGILVTDLTAAGLCPVPDAVIDMQDSVENYWKAIKNVGSDHEAYNPCDGSGANNPVTHNDHGNSIGCNFTACFGDFGIIDATRTILEKELHPDVFSHLKRISRF